MNADAAYKSSTYLVSHYDKCDASKERKDVRESAGCASAPSRRRIAGVTVKRRPIAAYILAGGASSRMGREKGLLEFDGVPLIVHTARLVEPLVSNVTVVGPAEAYAALGWRAIGDHADEPSHSNRVRRGPLAGIAAALSETRSPWNLVLACDLPFLSAAWVDWLLSRASDSTGQVVIPRTHRGLEPLAAVYRRECGPPIAEALARGERKVTDVIQNFQMDVVEASEWRHVDPGGLVLKNMNTPADYEEALKWWAARKLP